MFECVSTYIFGRCLGDILKHPHYSERLNISENIVWKVEIASLLDNDIRKCQRRTIGERRICKFETRIIHIESSAIRSYKWTVFVSNNSIWIIHMHICYISSVISKYAICYYEWMRLGSVDSSRSSNRVRDDWVSQSQITKWVCINSKTSSSNCPCKLTIIDNPNWYDPLVEKGTFNDKLATIFLINKFLTNIWWMTYVN